MVSDDVKANIKQKEIKELLAISYIFFKMKLQNLRYQGLV